MAGFQTALSQDVPPFMLVDGNPLAVRGVNLVGLRRRGFSPERDRVMLCGSMAMIKETAELLEGFGMKEGSNAEPGDYVLERAFVG